MAHPCLAFHACPQRRCTAWPWLFLLWTWIPTASFGTVELHPAATAGRLNNTGAWSAALPLDAGAQTLETRAAHPSGHYTATSTSGFTVSVPLAAISTVHDAEGNVTSLTFADGRVQTLTWDAFNQLVKVTERDGTNNGYDWSADYDALGRRLRTIPSARRRRRGLRPRLDHPFAQRPRRRIPRNRGHRERRHRRESPRPRPRRPLRRRQGPRRRFRCIWQHCRHPRRPRPRAESQNASAFRNSTAAVVDYHCAAGRRIELTWPFQTKTPST